MLPVLSVVTVNGKARAVAWAEETVQLKHDGEARQITLFEHGRVVLQILTSDFDACPAALLGWLKSRWREENFLKYASQNYGIDAICDYAADIETNTKITDNPARKEANAAVREAEKNLAAAERGLAVLLADPVGYHPRGQEHQADPRRRTPDRRRPPPARRGQEGPRRHPRQAARQPDRPPGAGGAAAHCPARPGHRADRWRTTPSTGYRTSSTPTCATTTNTAPSPAKPSTAAPPGSSSLPPTRSPSPSSGPPKPRSPAPWPCSSTR